jgi:hypothetical protein
LGRLGDGRAIILAEIENKEQVYTLQRATENAVTKKDTRQLWFHGDMYP